MELSITFFAACFYFAAAIGIVLWLQEISRPNPSYLNVATSLMFLGSGIIAFHLANIESGNVFQIPLSTFSFSTIVFYAGPVHYLYTDAILTAPKTQTPGVTFFHFLPAAVVFLFEILFYLFYTNPEQVILSVITSPLQELRWVFVLMAGVLHFLGYLLFVARKEIEILKIVNAKDKTIVLIMNTVLTLLFAVVLLIGFLGNLSLLITIAGIMLLILHLGQIIMPQRQPDFFANLRRDYKSGRYKKELLQGIDLGQIHRRIQELMDDEELYTDYDLSLRSMAKMLQVSQPRLSRFFNEHLKVDFRSYINNYRVEKAAELLVQDPSESVIRICYAVGFQSKSSFNNAFRRRYQVTPTQFRHNKTDA